ADKAGQAPGGLAARDPGILLDEVRSFARKKPGTYLAIALGAGVLAGRLTRGLTAPAADHTQTPTPPAPAAPPPYQVGTGQHAVTGGLPATPLGYDPVPGADPIIAVPPAG